MGGLLLKLVILAALVAAGFLGYQYVQSPEYQVTQSVRGFAKHVEGKDTEGALRFVSGRFRGFGDINSNLREDIDRKLGEGGWSSISVLSTRVTLDGDKAEVEACVYLKGNASSVDQGGGTGTYKVELDMEKEPDGVWRAITAAYEEAEGPRCGG